MRVPKNTVKKTVHHKVRYKPKNRPKPNWRFLLWSFLVAAVLGVAGSFALQTDILRVENIKIVGVRFADRGLVQDAADQLEGQNILVLRKYAVSRKLTGVKEIASVAVRRDFPNTVVVRVTERTPFCVLARNGSYCVMDTEGYLFHKTNGTVKGIPTVHVLGNLPLKEGFAATSGDIFECTKALELAEKKRLPVIKISIDLDGDMCLNMVGGLVVKLGQPEDIPRKMSILKTALVLRPSISREAAYIDVSCPRFPVWKPKSPDVAAS